MAGPKPDNPVAGYLVKPYKISVSRIRLLGRQGPSSQTAGYLAFYIPCIMNIN